MCVCFYVRFRQLCYCALIIYGDCFQLDSSWTLTLLCVVFLCVCVCGPDVGTVLKVISLRNGNSLESEEVTLEELQVFKVVRVLTWEPPLLFLSSSSPSPSSSVDLVVDHNRLGEMFFLVLIFRSSTADGHVPPNRV